MKKSTRILMFAGLLAFAANPVFADGPTGGDPPPPGSTTTSTSSTTATTLAVLLTYLGL